MTERLSLSLVSCTHLFPGGAVAKNPSENAGDSGDGGSIPRLGRSLGEGNGNPLQYSCLGNPCTEEPGRLQSMGSQRVRHNQFGLSQD